MPCEGLADDLRPPLLLWGGRGRWATLQGTAERAQSTSIDPLCTLWSLERSKNRQSFLLFSGDCENVFTGRFGA